MGGIKIVAAALLLASALGVNAQEYTRVVDRNYTVGLQTFANVGEPVARLRDYWEIKTPFAAYRADLAFKVSGCMSFGGWSVPANVDLPIVSTKTRKGVLYNAVQVPGMFGLLMLVAADGGVPGYLVQQSTGFPQGCRYTVSPAASLRPVVGAKIASERGYTNFELVYLGVSGETMRFLYREYTQEDMARPAFTQEITYDRSAPDVTFKKLKLKIASVDSTKVVYTVMEDGM